MLFYIFFFCSIQQLQGEKGKDEKSEEIYNKEKQADEEEKHELPESALFQPIQEKPRKKVEPSKEMQAAMKVLNDSLKKSPSKNISHQMKNAINIIQQEWFKISSTVNANPLEVEDYLDCFEECSSSLLEYIVNMTDSSGNTAMHYAVSHGNFDVVSILLDSKVCDINKANVAGYTAVMLAALAEVRNSTHASVANKLFQLADVNIRAKLVSILCNYDSFILIFYILFKIFSMVKLPWCWQYLMVEKIWLNYFWMLEQQLTFKMKMVVQP